MLKDLLLDILLPKKCVGCGKEGQYICKDCEIFLSEVPNLMEVRPPSVRSSVMSVWEYEGIIEKAILKIKYDGYYDIINELADKALEKIELHLPLDTYITYVPMFQKKEKQRGFNQAELIARKIGDRYTRQAGRLLEKVRDNRSQVDLGPAERIENVRDVFSAAPSELMEVRPQSVLLVDDVYTTGATMAECMKVLKKAGVKNIWGFTLARKLRI